MVQRFRLRSESARRFAMTTRATATVRLLAHSSRLPKGSNQIPAVALRRSKATYERTSQRIFSGSYLGGLHFAALKGMAVYKLYEEAHFTQRSAGEYDLCRNGGL